MQYGMDMRSKERMRMESLVEVFDVLPLVAGEDAGRKGVELRILDRVAESVQGNERAHGRALHLLCDKSEKISLGYSPFLSRSWRIVSSLTSKSLMVRSNASVVSSSLEATKVGASSQRR